MEHEYATAEQWRTWAAKWRNGQAVRPTPGAKWGWPELLEMADMCEQKATLAEQLHGADTRLHGYR
jgi:hypothetical protein